MSTKITKFPKIKLGNMTVRAENKDSEAVYIPPNTNLLGRTTDAQITIGAI